IRLDGLKAENSLHVVATCAFSNSGTGLHFFRDPVDGQPYLHTQFESREAHKAYANFDQPNIKGTFEFSVTAPDGWLVVSNTEAFEQPSNGPGTILHEMAHMWFGDLVTMDWWDDLWLNESFATYMGTLAQARATRFTNAWTRFSQGQKLWAMVQDQQPTTHPIVADAPDTETARTNFDGISYAKGASVLKQLVAWVGEEPFMEGIRTYFRRHEYGNANLDAFLGALEESSGRDLGAWSKEWLETAGVNTFRLALEVTGGRYSAISLEQT